MDLPLGYVKCSQAKGDLCEHWALIHVQGTWSILPWVGDAGIRELPAMFAKLHVTVGGRKTRNEGDSIAAVIESLFSKETSAFWEKRIP